MNNYKIQLLFALAVLLATNKSISQFTPGEPVVYAAGYGYTIQGKKIARIWKNYQTEDLGKGDLESVANSIYVVKGDVFVAGKEGKRACVWKNGEVRYLTDGKTDCEAMSVFVTGKNVYVAGFKYNLKTENYVATIWKDDETIHLTDASSSAKANGIFVYKDSIYACGYEEHGRNIARVWKNGVAQTLPEQTADAGTNNYATSIYVYNGDVHVTGYRKKTPVDSKLMYWKNGRVNTFGAADYDGSRSKGNNIYVEDGYVFIAGRMEASGSAWKATYWRGTGRHTVSGETGDTEAMGICAIGSDVYMVGCKTSNGKSTYKIWKNGVSKEMGISKYYSGGINAVFVVR